MKHMVVIVLCLLFVGCNKTGNIEFTEKVTIEKVNGKIEFVSIKFPFGQQRRLYTRKQLDVLIQSVDAMLVDMKHARDQMDALEPSTEEGSYEEP